MGKVGKMSKTILDILGTSTPVSEYVAQELGLVKAAIVCRVFFYQQLRDKVCKATNKSFQNSLGISAGTISSNLNWLLDNGWILNEKPLAKGNRPNHYKVTEKFYDLLERSSPERYVQEMNVHVQEMNGKEEVKEDKKERPGSGENFDYLDNVATHKPGQEGAVEPSGFEKHFGKYRDQILNIFSQEFSISLNPGRKELLIEMSRAERFDIKVLKKYAGQYNVNGGNPYDLEQFCSAYWRFLDGEKIKDAMYPDRKNSNTFDKTPSWEKTGKLVIS